MRDVNRHDDMAIHELLRQRLKKNIRHRESWNERDSHTFCTRLKTALGLYAVLHDHALISTVRHVGRRFRDRPLFKKTNRPAIGFTALKRASGPTTLKIARTQPAPRDEQILKRAAPGFFSTLGKFGRDKYANQCPTQHKSAARPGSWCIRIHRRKKPQ